MRPARVRLAGAFVALVAGTVAGLAVPLLLGHIVDLVVDDKPASALTAPAIVLLAVAVAQGVFTGLGTALVASAGEPALARLRERVVERALSLPLARVERAGTGDLLARISDDVAETADAVRNALPALAIAGLAVGLTVAGLAALDRRLALAGLCALPIQAWTVRWYLARASPLYAAECAAGPGRAQQLLDSIGGAATVRAFGLAEPHTARIARRSEAAVDLSLRTVWLQTRFYGRLNAAELAGTSAILGVGFLLVRSGAASVGEATAAALFFIRLFDPLNVLLGLIDDAQAAGASLARLVGVARMTPPAEPAAPQRPRDASVRLTGVHFAYSGGHDVLHGGGARPRRRAHADPGAAARLGDGHRRRRAPDRRRAGPAARAGEARPRRPADRRPRRGDGRSRQRGRALAGGLHRERARGTHRARRRAPAHAGGRGRSHRRPRRWRGPRVRQPRAARRGGWPLCGAVGGVDDRPRRPGRLDAVVRVVQRRRVGPRRLVGAALFRSRRLDALGHPR